MLFPTTFISASEKIGVGLKKQVAKFYFNFITKRFLRPYNETFMWFCSIESFKYIQTWYIKTLLIHAVSFAKPSMVFDWFGLKYARFQMWGILIMTNVPIRDNHASSQALQSDTWQLAFLLH